jgi:hypothetical protein
MHKNATKCNETLSKWCKNKYGASKIMDMLETYHSRLASKASQTYEPVAERAMKIRDLCDTLGGCTAALQKQVKKHAALDTCAKPMRARAIRALAASICSSSSVQAASDD